ncbi:hypothetical protein [Vibrio harveyi]|uniref:hypothetical protein n=1 Tax=Vibrio harveyi TaxID=669 RepID=UPI003CECB7A5
MNRILSYTLLLALSTPLIGCNVADKGGEDDYVPPEVVLDTACSRTATVEWNMKPSIYEYIIAGNECNELTKVVTNQVDEMIETVTYSGDEEYSVVTFNSNGASAVVKKYGESTAQTTYNFDNANNYIEVEIIAGDGGKSFSSIVDSNPQYEITSKLLSPEEAATAWATVKAESTINKNF